MTFEDWALQLGFTPEVRAWLHAAAPADARIALQILKAEAKHRYRALARAWHPDLGGSDEALKGLNEAWSVIEGLSVPDEPEPEIVEDVEAQMPVMIYGNWIKLG